ncbi:MAG: hypothetical protein ACE15D_03260 [Candidatus Eisenbacteria bacterium]
MKHKLLLFCSILAFAALPGIASADWFENFDSYVVGSGLHGQGGWHGWDGNPAADAYVTDLYSHSPSNSVSITGATDIVHEWDGYTSGVNELRGWVYIPSSLSGINYILLLNTYNDGGPYNWSSQVYFDGANDIIVSDPETDTLPLVYDQWVEVYVIIDLDLNIQTFYFNGQMLYQKSWTDGVSGGGVLDIACIDLFANSASPVYWDDLSLTIYNPVATQNTTWGKVKQSFR